MKTSTPLLVLLLIAFLACSPKHDKASAENHREHLTVNGYSPGLGDYMLKMQIRHSKLWFAGINENWELADFQLHEMEELLEDIEKFNSEKDEVKLIPMIEAPLDSVDVAVDAGDIEKFKSAYEDLTVTCNNCHVASKHPFNVVKVPETPIFSNQEFKP
jgi:hypothetical protein